ncbi:hypothetical protein [Oceanithermus sp.]
MTKPKIAVLLFALAAFAAGAQASRGYLYPGFAEIHEDVNLPPGSWSWFPSNALAGSLVDGTVRLLGVEEQRRTWRKGVVTFFYDGAGQAQLAYLTRGLGYSLYYDLDVDSGRLTGWAKIDNRLNEPLSFDHLTFVAGEVQLRAGGAPAMDKAARAYEGEMAMAAPAPAMPEYAGSAGGVFRYELDEPPVLEAGVTELPFIRESADVIYTWTYNGGFTRGERVVFQRGYRFEAPAPLAGGLVNIRDRGVLLGQAYMEETASGGVVQLRLGRDPEGIARRVVTVLKDTRKEKAYRVTTTVSNARRTPVRVEIRESFSAKEVVLDLPKGARRTSRGYAIEFILAPGAERSFTYTVTLRY